MKPAEAVDSIFSEEEEEHNMKKRISLLLAAALIFALALTPVSALV